jgi:thiol-disulfide isomerase/thioredoxin
MLKQISLGIVLLSASFAFAQTVVKKESLRPGSLAPEISFKKWLKGTQFNSLESDKTYVVEFWATWCGPCRESIPHLTEMAKKYKDITFLGVGIWEKDENGVLENFVKEMGSKMDYNVAYSGEKDGMAETWMNAAGQNGIPTAFVVKNGTIQWIGHPMTMDQALKDISEGKFSLEKAQTQFAAAEEASKKQDAFFKKLDELDKKFEAGKRAEAKSGYATLVKENPDFATYGQEVKMVWDAIENPKAFLKSASTVGNNSGTDKKERASSYASVAYRLTERKELGLAKSAVQALLKSTKYQDLIVMYYSVNVFKVTKSDAERKKTAQAGLAFMEKHRDQGNDFMRKFFEENAK